MLLLGIAGDGETAELRVDDVVNHDLTIRGSFSYDASAWRQVVDAVNAGTVRPSVLVTHRYELDEWETAISVLRSGDGDAPRGKVLLDLPR